MKSLKLTEGAWKVSPVNSNLVISEKTQECVAIVMSGKFNGIAFTDDREKKQGNAKLVAKSREMYGFLVRLLEIIPKNNNTSAFGNTLNEYFNDKYTIGEMIENLIEC